MSLDSLVTVSIVAQTAGITRKGFGTTLIAAYHTVFPGRVRVYTKTSDMLTDGFTAGHPAYLAAVALMSQVPAPKEFKIGRLASTPNAHVETLVASPTAGAKYSIDIADKDGIVTTVSYTADATPTPTEIHGALLTAINAISGMDVTATGGTTDLVLTGDVAGEVYALRAYDNVTGHLWTRTNGTADAGIATDLAAIAAADDQWFGLGVDQQSELVINAAAAWAETNRKLFAFTTGDTAAKTGAVGGGDVLDDQKTAARAYTYGFYSDRPHEHLAVGLLGRMLPLDPGRGTYAHKTVRNTSAVPLTATHITNIEAKYGNWYAEVAGKNITFPGKTGANEWIDTTVAIEWLKARIQEEIFLSLTLADKVAFNDKGIAGVEGKIRSAWTTGIGNDALNDDLIVTVPDASAVSGADKTARQLTGVQFTGTVAGAIHTLAISGTVGA